MEFQRTKRRVVHGGGPTLELTDIVPCPERAEAGAGQREFTDQFDGPRIRFILSNGAAKRCNHFARGRVPVVLELTFFRVKQQGPQSILPSGQAGRERDRGRVRGKNVEVAIFQEGRNIERVQKVAEPCRNSRGTRLPTDPQPGVRKAEQIFGFNLIQLQNTDQGLQDLRRRVIVASTFEPEIVVGTDSCQERDLLAAEPSHPAMRAARESDLFGSDKTASRAQILAKSIVLRAVIHSSHASSGVRTKRGPVTTRNSGDLSAGRARRHHGQIPLNWIRKTEKNMDISNRTVLIVGGTSGIGLGLARRFAAAGSTVIVGGRHTGTVSDLETVEIDVADPGSVVSARDAVLAAHPGLDVVVTMSGVMIVEDLRDPAHISQAETTIAVNLLGTIRVIDAFTPHLISSGAGDIITVTSGIGFLPFPLMPSYGASKAAVHAYTEALRAHLAGTGVEVTELIPPAVANAGQEKLNPAALPLDDFLDEVIALVTQTPTPNEIVVKAAERLRWAERDGTYAELLQQRSQSLSTLPGR